MAGVGGAVAGTIGGTIGDALSQINTSPSDAKCFKCGSVLPAGAKFCLECGERVSPAGSEQTVLCPECGKTVAKGKFCPECGHKLATACPDCGTEISAGTKFCPECGRKL